jgi:hypothetical protein
MIYRNGLEYNSSTGSRINVGSIAVDAGNGIDLLPGAAVQDYCRYNALGHAWISPLFKDQCACHMLQKLMFASV